MVIFQATDKNGHCVFYRNAAQAIRESKRSIARSVRSAKAEHKIYNNTPEVYPISIYRMEFTMDKDALIDILNSEEPLKEHRQLIQVVTPRSWHF